VVNKCRSLHPLIQLVLEIALCCKCLISTGQVFTQSPGSYNGQVSIRTRHNRGRNDDQDSAGLLLINRPFLRPLQSFLPEGRSFGLDPCVIFLPKHPLSLPSLLSYFKKYRGTHSLIHVISIDVEYNVLWN